MGVLVTRGHAIETLARANHYVFDKTGTLTFGRMTLEEVRPLGALDADGLCALGAALEQGSEHPVAAGLRAAAEGKARVAVSEVVAVTGQGMAGRYEGGAVWIGRPDFVAAQIEAASQGRAVSPKPPEPSPVHPARSENAPYHEPSIPHESSMQHEASIHGELAALANSVGTVVALGDERGWLGLFRLADAIRPAAADLVQQLAAARVPVTILSGDAPSVVAAVGRELGITDVHGGMLPQDKQAFIARLQSDPAKVVVMVGDGVNDAPVLAQAHVSVAMGSGTDLARNQADIVLLGEDFGGLHAGAGLARKTLRIIRQNLCWSLAYNFSAVPLAMFGWVTPLMAGIGMAGSSLLVVLNALRLQQRRRKV
jgi:Cu2+-exporting ATPase